MLDLHHYDYIMISIYFLLLITIATFTRRIRTFKDFAVGNKTLPFSLLFASIAATYVGPGGSIGFTGKGFENGYLFFFLAILYPIQSIITGVFLAPRIQKMTNCASVGDIFSEKYGNFSKIAAGIISSGLCLGFAAIMAMVGGKMLSSFTGFSMLLSVVIISGITTLYVFTGGLRASVATDVFQFSVFSIVVPVFFFLTLMHLPESSSLEEMASALTKNSFEALSSLQILGLALTFYLGEMLIPPYINRALAAKTGGDSTISFVLSGSFGFAWLAVIFSLGVAAVGILPADTPPDNVFMTLAGKVLPNGLYGLLIIAILGIIMSSQDSVINSGATTMVRDVVFFFNLNREKELLCGRIFTIVMAVAAGALALYLPSIIDSVLITYTIWAPTVAFPLVIALFLKRQNNAWAGVLSICMGALGTLIWGVILEQPPFGIPPVLAGLVSCFVGFAIGMTIDRRREVF